MFPKQSFLPPCCKFLLIIANQYADIYVVPNAASPSEKIDVTIELGVKFARYSDINVSNKTEFMCVLKQNQ